MGWCKSHPIKENMIIKYIRNKPKLSINTPVGSGNKKATGKIHFVPGATHVFSDEEGSLLLKLDNVNFKEIDYVDEEEKKEENVVLAPKPRGRPKRVIDDNIDNI